MDMLRPFILQEENICTFILQRTWSHKTFVVVVFTKAVHKYGFTNIY